MSTKDMFTKKQLEKSCKKYYETVDGGPFYDHAVKWRDKDTIGAATYLLATWNTKKFPDFAKNRDNKTKLKEILEDITLHLGFVVDSLQTADFENDKLSKKITERYIKLAAISGVEYTGAAKILHLFNPELLVMWDRKIREHYGIGEDKKDYLEFQILMQEKAKNIKWDGNDFTPYKSLAKAVDEHNFVSIPGIYYK